MAYTAPDFTTAAVINENTKVKEVDEQLNILMGDVKKYLEDNFQELAEEVVLVPQGPRGKSAYELAVENGFIGTEAEWLTSLVGPPGGQELLVSGENIKTINNQSILGMGNIEISGSGSIDDVNVSSETTYSSMFIEEKFNEKANTEDVYAKTEANSLLEEKQETLVSGENIKTINNQSILGMGNIEISGSGSIDDVNVSSETTYSSMFIEEKLAQKANTEDVYSKSAINELFLGIGIGFDYSETTNPTATINPTRGQGATWINKVTGVIYVLFDATENKNRWKGTDGELVGYLGSTEVFDVLEDGSATALYQFEDNLFDTGGAFNGTGTVVYGTGKFGRCVTSGKVDTGTKTLMPHDGSYSVSAWVYRDAAARLGIAQRNNANTGAGNGDSLYVETNGAITFQKTNSSVGGTLETLTGPVLSSGWRHVALSFNRSANVASLYVDGAVGATKSNWNTGTYDNNLTVLIGGRHDVDQFGTIDQVRFFNRAITQAEVTQLFLEVEA